jgi:hypothetical protein
MVEGVDHQVGVVDEVCGFFNILLVDPEEVAAAVGVDVEEKEEEFD